MGKGFRPAACGCRALGQGSEGKGTVLFRC